MDVHFTSEHEKQLTNISARTGRPTDELVQDVMTGYVFKLADVGETLDRRYDDIRTDRVELVDGEIFFDDLRQREDALLNLSSDETRSGLSPSP